MCSSKPKIPQNKTPPAPLAPEPAPDAPTIGNEREQMARARGMTIPRPDLSGLGNQETGPAVSRLLIGPSKNTPVNPADEIARLEQENQKLKKPTRPVGGNSVYADRTGRRR